MPFAEVTLDKNGNKTLTPITESTSTTAADALAIAEKALPLDGSKEMTGELIIKSSNINLNIPPASSQYPKLFANRDVNNNNFYYIEGQQRASGATRTRIANNCYNGENKILSYIDIGSEPDGTTYAVTPTPSTTAPNTAIQTKESVARDYLAKSGGEMTGTIYMRSSNLDDDSSPGNTYSQIMWLRDKNNKNCGGIDFGKLVGGEPSLSFWRTTTIDDVTKHSTVRIGLDNTGASFFIGPHPRPDNYGNDIVTTKAMKNFAPMKLTQEVNGYIGGANASDTADLFVGRGLSADKPFNSIPGALACFNSLLCGPYNVNLIIMDDREYTWSGDVIINPMWTRLQVRSSTTANIRRSIKTTGLNILSGALYFSFIELIADSPIPYFIKSFGHAHNSLVRMRYDTIFTGTVTEGTVAATSNGLVLFEGLQHITSNVTGPRYKCTNGSKILLIGGATENRIPGTEAGTVDASSTVA